MEAIRVEEWILHRYLILRKMLHIVGASGHRESNIFNSKTQNTEAGRRKRINDRSSTWERGRSTVIEGTVKQQMGEGGGGAGAAGGGCTVINNCETSQEIGLGEQ
ncbi:hypothetical protein TIFTF001_028966 [Ficus carica]|uniref:Uncharacterized protein n=1 Tax=Ficus carica TaxID=3494 RepID=A0AA88DQX5_FICCA|nr:hypothetical protein TIFTF001_028966 [Ficus carica]